MAPEGGGRRWAKTNLYSNEIICNFHNTNVSEARQYPELNSTELDQTDCEWGW